MGGPHGIAGGAAGGKPRIAQEIVTVTDEAQVIALIEKIIQFYAAHGRTMERLGATGWAELEVGASDTTPKPEDTR